MKVAIKELIKLVIIYLVGAGTTWEYNPALWGDWWRALLVVIWAISLVHSEFWYKIIEALEDQYETDDAEENEEMKGL